MFDVLRERTRSNLEVYSIYSVLQSNGYNDLIRLQRTSQTYEGDPKTSVDTEEKIESGCADYIKVSRTLVVLICKKLKQLTVYSPLNLKEQSEIDLNSDQVNFGDHGFDIMSYGP